MRCKSGEMRLPSTGSWIVAAVLAADAGLAALTACGSSSSLDGGGGGDAADAVALVTSILDGASGTSTGSDAGGDAGETVASDAAASGDASAAPDAPYDGPTVEAGVLSACPTSGVVILGTTEPGSKLAVTTDEGIADRLGPGPAARRSSGDWPRRPS